MPESGDYVIGTRSDDGAKLYIDGKLVVSKWVPQDNVTNVKSLHLEEGKSYDVELDYFDGTGDAICHFVWIKPSEKREVAQRTLWIPPGTWIDPLARQRFTGPRMLTLDVPLNRMPVFVREGSTVFLSQEVESTAKGIWQNPMLDIYPPDGDCSFSRTMYEDDGISPEYQGDKSARTTVKVQRKGDKLTIDIGPAVGSYSGMPSRRAWTVRVDIPGDVESTNPKIDGTKVSDRWTGLPIRPSSSLIRTPFNITGGRILVVPESNLRTSHHVEVTLVKNAKG